MKVQDALKQNEDLRMRIAAKMHDAELRDRKNNGGAGHDRERAAAYKRILDNSKKEW